MGLLLHIDTATEYASVCLSKDGISIGFAENSDQKNHGSFLQPAIQTIFKITNSSLTDIDAISVSNGPGSYTGLRVGLASAKGLCYALNKPLLAINTLELIANAAIENMRENKTIEPSMLFCPLIDARRMEVFTAIYNQSLKNIEQPSAKILNENTYTDILKQHKIVFCGSGSYKLQTVLQHPSAIFSTIQHNASHLITIAEKQFINKKYTNLAYLEPYYYKEIYVPQKS